VTNAEVKSDKCLKILIEIEKGQGWSRKIKKKWVRRGQCIPHIKNRSKKWQMFKKYPKFRSKKWQMLKILIEIEKCQEI